VSPRDNAQNEIEPNKESGIIHIPFDAMRRPSVWYRMRRSILMAKTPIFGFIILMWFA